MGIHNEVVTWTPDSKRIVFLSRRDASNGWTKRPSASALMADYQSLCRWTRVVCVSFSADGTKIAYNLIFRNFRTVEALHRRTCASHHHLRPQKQLQSKPAAHRVHRHVPHVARQHDLLQFRPRHLNITSTFTATISVQKQVEQLTHFTDFDVMWPSLGLDAIIFENAGYLYTLDFQSKQPKKLSISSARPTAP